MCAHWLRLLQEYLKAPSKPCGGQECVWVRVAGHEEENLIKLISRSPKSDFHGGSWLYIKGSVAEKGKVKNAKAGLSELSHLTLAPAN